MRVCLLLCLCCAVHFGDGYIASPKKSSILYKTKQKDITIKIMIHIDKDASKKMVAEYKTKYRRKLKDAVRGILEDARTLLLHPSLNQTVRFKLLGIQFLRSARFVSANEDATKYLASYCDWQSRKKFEDVHYSILLSGLDLYYMNGGKKVRRSTGRSYQSGVCSYRKSCALLQWDKKNMAYLVAHELGHSLGISHDGFQNHCPDQKYIMASKYDKAHHPKVWSSCSQKYVKQFLQNRKSWCIK